MARDLPGGKKGAGILRAKPNIHWKKDRGKEPTRDRTAIPLVPEKTAKFTGERVQRTCILGNAEKRAAREKAGGKQPWSKDKKSIWPYPGSRWWKFDFHTHTPVSSDTFWAQQNPGLAAEDWLLRYMAAAIDCVARDRPQQRRLDRQAQDGLRADEATGR